MAGRELADRIQGRLRYVRGWAGVLVEAGGLKEYEQDWLWVWRGQRLRGQREG